ncbi:Bax inhibitor-1 family protein, partial [Salmonella enterica]
VIYNAIITLTGVSLAYLFSGGATLFVIVGIMFSLYALFIFYLNISSGLFRPFIFLEVSGIIAAIVVISL